MFNFLKDLSTKPSPYSVYSPEELWNDEHISKMLLNCHLDRDIDMASRNHNFIDESVIWLDEMFKIKDLDICDFGCGPGLYCTRLTERGARVTGIDISKNSINYATEYAKNNKLKINYINSDYLNYKIQKKFDLIIMIYCDFCSLSKIQRSYMLNMFRDKLKSGGKVVLDVYSENSFTELEESSYYEKDMHNGFWSNNSYFGFTNSFKYTEDKISLDRYTIVEKSRTRSIYNWLQYFSVETLKKEFMDNGLNIKYIYSDVKGSLFHNSSKEIAVIAELK